MMDLVFRIDMTTESLSTQAADVFTVAPAEHQPPVCGELLISPESAIRHTQGTTQGSYRSS
jgi:hypothetical protein